MEFNNEERSVSEWMSVPAFGDWDMKNGVPSYSMDFSMIRDSRKLSKSQFSLGNEEDLLPSTTTTSRSADDSRNAAADAEFRSAEERSVSEWKSVPAFGDWDTKNDVPSYSMDFSKIREARKLSKPPHVNTGGSEEDLPSSCSSTTSRSADDHRNATATVVADYRERSVSGWKSVPAFGDWDMKNEVPSYSMDFSKIREARKLNRSYASASSNDYDSLSCSSSCSSVSRAVDNHRLVANRSAAHRRHHSQTAKRSSFMNYFSCCIGA